MKFPDVTLDELKEAVAEREKILESNWPKKAHFNIKIEDDDEIDMFLENTCGIVSSLELADEIRDNVEKNLFVEIVVNKDHTFNISTKLNEVHQ